jgi:hypothetical protein
MASEEIGFQHRVNRRTFLSFSFAAVTVGGGEADRPVTFSQWLKASRNARKLALKPCLERIEAMDGSIQAWVQVRPEEPTGNGKLAEIPFGVKDVIETKGLATEYGSPVYKGRVGTADAAIVRELRRHGGVLLGKTQCAAFAYRTPPPLTIPATWHTRQAGVQVGLPRL